MEQKFFVFLVLSSIMVLFAMIAGCAGNQPNVTSTQTPTSITSPIITTQSSSPKIAISITSFSKIGSSNIIKGEVEGVLPAEISIITYKKVNNNWWGPQPSLDGSQITIQPDGTWECEILMEGADENITEVVALLVPKSYSPPDVEGQISLPSELYRYPHTTASREG